MRHVIHNMVVNACEAMPKGGTVRIIVENIPVKGEDGLSLKDGEYLRISIKDNGAGIPEENLHRIFDPYFSTKQRGTQKGMGFGLAVCHSIVKNHDGLITVKSEQGNGTTFSIYLPASKNP